MKSRTTKSALLASMLAGACASSASADYTGLTVSLHTTVSINSVSRDVYRVYANFDEAGDRLVGVFGSPTMGAFTVESRNSSDTSGGSAFFNIVANGIKAPTADQISDNPNAEWDTFGTIGLAVADQSPYGDFTGITPGFTGILGTSTTITNGAWFCIPTFDHDGNVGTPQIPPPQTLAGWTGDGDAALRVLVLQLTVNAGENVRGVINIDIFPPMGQGGGQTVTHLGFQSFNSFTAPAPSVLALLGLAGIAGGRRRRTA